MEFFEKESALQKNRVMFLFVSMGNIGKIWDITKFRYEGDGIYVFKADQSRYFCFFFKDAKIIVTNAFMKKSQKMPQKEKQKALMAYKNYIKKEK